MKLMKVLTGAALALAACSAVGETVVSVNVEKWGKSDSYVSVTTKGWGTNKKYTKAVINVPAGAPAGSYGVAATFDLAAFEGRPLGGRVTVTSSTLGTNNTGFKFQFIDYDPEEADSGNKYRYCGEMTPPSVSLAGQTIQVDDKISGGMRRPKGRFFIGLQGVSGKVEVDLTTLKVVTDEPIFPDVNPDLVADYSDAVRNAPQRRGVMLPARACTEDDFQTLQHWGVTLGRYQMTDLPTPGASESTSAYLARYNAALNAKLDHLENDVLPWAVRYGVDIVVDLHTAPGGRKSDSAMWQMLDVQAYADEFIAIWQRIATRFLGKAGIYGYDLANEPYQVVKASVCDYWTIQNLAAQAIRAIDPETPIVVEANNQDSPWAFSYLSPFDLRNVIYQVHMYEPGSYTHQGVNGGAFTPVAYPREGRDREYLKEVLAATRAFQLKHGAKIYVGEFSAPCWAEGADLYIGDCADLFNEYGWDWTYHAFREWEGWSVEHQLKAGKQGITSDCFEPSSDNPRKRALLSRFGTQSFGFWSVRQDEDGHAVTVDYNLPEGAYVTMDVLTNGVPIGGANVTHVAGDCFRWVEASEFRTLSWFPRKSWPGHRFANGELSVRLSTWSESSPPDVLVVNLKSRTLSCYPSLDFLPDGGLTNRLYRTDRIVFKKVPAAGQTFVMGRNMDSSGTEGPYRDVTFDSDFYLAVFETTRAQYRLLGGVEVAANQATPFGMDDPDECPVAGVTYNYLRGTENVWPGGGYEGVGGALKAMQDSFGLKFDLPTSAQWEYACRAGTTTALYNGKSNTSQYSNSDVAELAWYYYNSDNGTKVHAVGGKPANPWGFHDLYGNVREWCLDWAGDTGTAAETDPKGPQSGTARVWRSSDYASFSSANASGFLSSTNPRDADGKFGFRLCLPVRFRVSAE